MSETFNLTGISSVAMHTAGHNNAEHAHLTPITPLKRLHYIRRR